MSHFTKKDILRLVEEEDVEFIRLQFTDLYGNLKNAAITVSQLERVLDNNYVFDGSCVDGFVDDNDTGLWYTSPSPGDMTGSRMPESE